MFVLSNQYLIEFSPHIQTLTDSFIAIDQFISILVQQRASLFREKVIFELTKEEILSVLSNEPMQTNIFPTEISIYEEFSASLLVQIEKVALEILGNFDREKFQWNLRNQEDACIITATENGEIVGFNVGYKRERLKYYSWFGGVIEQHRSRGIASSLIKEQHQWCQRRGYKEIETEIVSKWKKMLALNLKFGFEIEGVKISKTDGQKIILKKRL